MSRNVIRILCVDDHAFLAEGLRTRIALERDMEFVGWIGSADDLLAEARRARPDVILLDIEMPGRDPFEVLRDLVREQPQVRAVMLSAYVRDRYLDAAIASGAWGYLSKSDSPDSVLDAVRKAAAGEFAFGPSVLERCRVEGVGPGRGSAGRPKPSSKLDLLTLREIQVLRLIGKGMSRVEIAKTLSRSPKTIDNHRAAIMEKLGIHDRVELARYAIEEGLAEV
jgi:two-component system response regulator NreC